MGTGPSPGGDLTNLELAFRLIPPEGNDWGAIAHDPEAEVEFLERVRPHLHPDYETIWSHPAAGVTTTAGLGPTLAALRAIGSAFETLVAVPETYVDLGDRVLVLLTREGRTTDGTDFAEEGAAMYIFEEGQMRRMELYSDRTSVLETVGLTEAEAVERGVPVSEAKP